MREDVKKAAEILSQWGIVALPTETVYGLAGDARNEFAVRKIFKLKGRPSFNPLIVHIEGLEVAQEIGDFSPMSLHLAEVFWPGPLTIVVPLRPTAGISSLVTAGLHTIALRAPDHPLAQMVLSYSGLALAAPSANPSGELSPTSPQHVRALLPDVDFVLEGGETTRGIESTIVMMDQDDRLVRILRPGPITKDSLARASGLEVVFDEQIVSDDRVGSQDNAPIAPGALLKHYSPQAKVRLNASDYKPDEGILGFGPERTPDGVPFYNLSEGADLDEAAQHLFAGLHWMDRQGVSAIAVRPIPHQGVGIAINDRLRRAAVD